MPAVLPLAEQMAFLGDGVTSSEEAVVQAILDHVEDLFLGESNRRERPFKASTDSSPRTEVHPGTGSRLLVLDYPISALAADIKLGFDTSSPDETITYNDVEYVVWVAGRRSIERTDGGLFGPLDVPRYVHVTYTAAADYPELAKLAIKRITAQIFRQRGSEDAASESVAGAYSRTMAKFGRDFVDDDPIWKLAVRNQWEPRI